MFSSGGNVLNGSGTIFFYGRNRIFCGGIILSSGGTILSSGGTILSCRCHLYPLYPVTFIL
jgi:hypothetical protein